MNTRQPPANEEGIHASGEATCRYKARYERCSTHASPTQVGSGARSRQGPPPTTVVDRRTRSWCLVQSFSLMCWARHTASLTVIVPAERARCWPWCCWPFRCWFVTGQGAQEGVALQLNEGCR